MALATNTRREYTGLTPDAVTRHKLAASIHPYRGSAIGAAPGVGYARPLVAGDYFLGFAEEEVDNSSGSAGDDQVQVIEHGIVWLSAITGASGVADKNKPVYASDDGTFTLTASTNSLIGRISNYDANRGFAVAFEAASRRVTW